MTAAAYPSPPSMSESGHGDRHGKSSVRSLSAAPAAPGSATGHSGPGLSRRPACQQTRSLAVTDSEARAAVRVTVGWSRWLGCLLLLSPTRSQAGGCWFRARAGRAENWPQAGDSASKLGPPSLAQRPPLASQLAQSQVGTANFKLAIRVS